MLLLGGANVFFFKATDSETKDDAPTPGNLADFEETKARSAKDMWRLLARKFRLAACKYNFTMYIFLILYIIVN